MSYLSVARFIIYLLSASRGTTAGDSRQVWLQKCQLNGGLSLALYLAAQESPNEGSSFYMGNYCLKGEEFKVTLMRFILCKPRLWLVRKGDGPNEGCILL